MNYFNIKRYKFSTVTKYIVNTGRYFLKFFKYINYKIYNFKKINKYIDVTSFDFKKVTKYLDTKNYNINTIKKVKFFSSDFLLFHLPASIIFFLFLYLLIPTFYNYDKSNIKKFLCKNKKIECLIKGKISYRFYPTPRIKIENLVIKNLLKNKKTLLTADNVAIKLSFKNLLAKEKHEFKGIRLKNYEINLDLKKLKEYKFLFEKINSIPIILSSGRITFYDEKNYVAKVDDANIKLKIIEDSIEANLKGEFLDDNIYVNLNREKIDNNKVSTDIILKMTKNNFFIKTNLINFKKNKDITSGNFLIKKDKNQITAIFDYKNNELLINKSNLKNPFLEGGMTGKITFLPYFNFNLDLDLNSINFTKLYNYFLALDNKKQINLFKVNKKINGTINLSSDKIYSSYNLVKSIETHIQFNNGNVSIERFLFNLGKLGASDLLGEINNEKKFTNFRFESNIFVDNKKKFLSKFGIYDKKDLPSNFFISGNIDLENKKATFYEISDNKKLSNNDINFIEKEFNDYMFEDGFSNLFLFPKFKEFIKSITNEVD